VTKRIGRMEDSNPIVPHEGNIRAVFSCRRRSSAKCRFSAFSACHFLDVHDASPPILLGMQQHYQEAARPKCNPTPGALGATRTGRDPTRLDASVLAISLGNSEALTFVRRVLGDRVADRSAMQMTFFCLLFPGCALSAGLFGYSIGYLNGVRDANTADVGEGDRGLSEN
jgi:hypothetical protein